MVLDYQAIEKDGRTLIYPNVNEIPTTFEGVVDLLTPDYFNTDPKLETERFARFKENKAELKLNYEGNVGSNFELYLIDSSNNLPKELPTSQINGVAISGYISESLDLKFPKIPRFFYGQERSIYEHLFISLLQKRDYHEVEKEIKGIETKYDDPRLNSHSPLCLWVGPYNNYCTHFEFYLFNPNKERVNLGLRELPRFAEFIQQNQEEVNNLASLIVNEKLTLTFGTDILGNIDSKTLVELKKKSEQRHDLTDKLLKDNDFSELASLMYKNGADYFCLF